MNDHYGVLRTSVQMCDIRSWALMQMKVIKFGIC